MPEGLDRTGKMPSSPLHRRLPGITGIGRHHRYRHRPRPHHHRPPHRRLVVFFFHLFNLAELLHRRRRLWLHAELAGLAPPRRAEHGRPERRRLRRPVGGNSEVDAAAAAADVAGAGAEERGNGDGAGSAERGLALENLGDADAVGGGRGRVGGGGAAGARADVSAVGAERGEALAEANVADAALPALGGVFRTFPDFLFVDVDRRHYGAVIQFRVRR